MVIIVALEILSWITVCFEYKKRLFNAYFRFRSCKRPFASIKLIRSTGCGLFRAQLLVSYDRPNSAVCQSSHAATFNRQRNQMSESKRLQHHKFHWQTFSVQINFHLIKIQVNNSIERSFRFNWLCSYAERSSFIWNSWRWLFMNETREWRRATAFDSSKTNVKCNHSLDSIKPFRNWHLVQCSAISKLTKNNPKQI